MTQEKGLEKWASRSTFGSVPTAVAERFEELARAIEGSIPTCAERTTAFVLLSDVKRCLLRIVGDVQ